MKAQVTMIEAIISIIILFIGFSIIFPPFTKQSRWNDAYLIVKGRDLILTMDRTGALGEYSFNAVSLQNFIDKNVNDSVIWTSVDGTIKNKLVVACNCTDEEMSQLDYWMKDLKFNNHEIDAYICRTNLEGKINPCFSYLEYPDVLVIWKYRDLSSYFGLMEDFLNAGNGIIQIADITAIDPVHEQIFGIKFCPGFCDYPWGIDDNFIKPDDSSLLTYEPFKYFYHIPFPAKAYEINDSVPLEAMLLSCSSKKGNFTFRGNTNDFWICDDSEIAYFDTDNNGKADMNVTVRESFNINGYNFSLSYVEKNSSILISFNYTYKFVDFFEDGGVKIVQAENDEDKILLSFGNYLSWPQKTAPVVIVNGTIGKTAWITDFTRNGFNNIGDDHKQLFNSLLMFVSNKKAKEATYGVMTGGEISYINVMNYDVFEIYNLDLGVGRPF